MTLKYVDASLIRWFELMETMQHAEVGTMERIKMIACFIFETSKYENLWKSIKGEDKFEEFTVWFRQNLSLKLEEFETVSLNVMEELIPAILTERNILVFTQEAFFNLDTILHTFCNHTIQELERNEIQLNGSKIFLWMIITEAILFHRAVSEGLETNDLHHLEAAFYAVSV